MPSRDEWPRLSVGVTLVLAVDFRLIKGRTVVGNGRVPASGKRDLPNELGIIMSALRLYVPAEMLTC